MFPEPAPSSFCYHLLIVKLPLDNATWPTDDRFSTHETNFQSWMDKIISRFIVSFPEGLQTGEHIGRYLCGIEQTDRHLKIGKVFPGHGMISDKGEPLFCFSFLVFKIGPPAESSMQGVVSLLYAHGTNI